MQNYPTLAPTLDRFYFVVLPRQAFQRGLWPNEYLLGDFCGILWPFVAAGSVPSDSTLRCCDYRRFAFPGCEILDIDSAFRGTGQRPVEDCQINERKRIDVECDKTKPVVGDSFSLPGQEEEVTRTGKRNVPKPHALAALGFLLCLSDSDIIKAQKIKNPEVHGIVKTPVQKMSV